MSVRLLPLLAACLAAAGLSQAAPAPIRKAQPEQPEVQLHGWLPPDQTRRDVPSVIVSQADYQAVARALKITNPPKVNFRTHFLFVYAEYGGRRATQSEIVRG